MKWREAGNKKQGLAKVWCTGKRRELHKIRGRMTNIPGRNPANLNQIKFTLEYFLSIYIYILTRGRFPTSKWILALSWHITIQWPISQEPINVKWKLMATDKYEFGYRVNTSLLSCISCKLQAYYINYRTLLYVNCTKDKRGKKRFRVLQHHALDSV